MITSDNFDQLTKQIIVSYAHLLKLHLTYCRRYKNFKIKLKTEQSRKDFKKMDQFFYYEDGSIKWETINLLMPPKIEWKIKDEYKMLNENEIKICCLILFNVPCIDIAEVLQYTHKSVHSISHRIKLKTGMKNIKESLSKLLIKIDSV